MRLAAFLARALPAACIALAACAYDPPVKADHDLPKYRADLKKCQIQSSNTVSAVRNATVGSALRNIFASDEPVREDIRKCMQARGYSL